VTPKKFQINPVPALAGFEKVKSGGATLIITDLITASQTKTDIKVCLCLTLAQFAEKNSCTMYEHNGTNSITLLLKKPINMQCTKL